MSRLVVLLLCITVAISCSKYDPIPTIVVKEHLRDNDKIDLLNEIKSIEYITLETNDTLLLSPVYDMCVSKDYIFVYVTSLVNNTRKRGVLQFDRRGKYIRTITSVGNAPGELPRGIANMYAIEDEQKIYISLEMAQTMSFSFNGTFNGCVDINTECMYGYRYPLGKKHVCFSFVMIPIGMHEYFYGVGLFSDADEMLLNKSDFIQVENPDDMALKVWYKRPAIEGVLFGTLCNDTIFKITSQSIQPVMVVKNEYSKDFIRKYMDVMNKDSYAAGFVEQWGMFETERYYYVRTFLDTGSDWMLNIHQINKNIHEIKTTTVKANNEYQFQMRLAGLENQIDGGVPIWPEWSFPEYGVFAQAVTADGAIGYLKKYSLWDNAPTVLKSLSEDSNSIIILYHY